MIAYRFDRRNEMFEGKTINLTKVDVQNSEFFKSILENDYLEGFTSHGLSYFTQPIPIDNKLSLLSALVESIFEHRRQTRFPEMTSRYQSIFAIDTLEEAKKWRRVFPENPDKIEYPLYEIEYDPLNAVKLDASLLTLGNSHTIFEGTCNAERYWRGDISDQPTFELLIKTPAKVLRKLPPNWYL